MPFLIGILWCFWGVRRDGLCEKLLIADKKFHGIIKLLWGVLPTNQEV